VDLVVEVSDADGQPAVLGHGTPRRLARTGGVGELLMATPAVALVVWTALDASVGWLVASLLLVVAVAVVVLPRRVRHHVRLLSHVDRSGAAIVRDTTKPAARVGLVDPRHLPREVSVREGASTFAAVVLLGAVLLSFLGESHRIVMPAAMLAAGIPAWSQPLAVALVERARGVVLARARFGHDTVWVAIPRRPQPVLHLASDDAASADATPADAAAPDAGQLAGAVPSGPAASPQNARHDGSS
jgi:hypothetical protein